MMMPRVYWIFLGLLLLAGTALAQGPGRGDRPRDTQVLTGNVLEVNAAQRSFTIALRVKANDPNAPGKVPDELAQKAAQLSDELKQAEAKKETRRVERLRRLIQELLCWREVQRTVTPADKVMLVGSRRVPLSTLAVGMRIGVPVRVEGEVADDLVPAKASVIGDIAILNGLENVTSVRRQGLMPGKKPVTFLQVVGIVTATAPLTLRIATDSMVLDVPTHFMARQNVPIGPQEIQPGLRLFAEVQLRKETEIVGIRYINVLFFKPDTPLPAEATGVH